MSANSCPIPAVFANQLIGGASASIPGLGLRGAPFYLRQTLKRFFGGNLGTACVAFVRGKRRGILPVGGGVASVNVTAGGSGYTTPPSASVTLLAGTVFVEVPTFGTVVTAANAVTSVPVTNPGWGFGAGPGLSFFGGGGSGATAVGVLQTGWPTPLPAPSL